MQQQKYKEGPEHMLDLYYQTPNSRERMTYNSSNKWQDSQLTLHQTKTSIPEGHRYSFLLCNHSDDMINLEQLDVLKKNYELKTGVRFLRFGLNMPGDPVQFGHVKNGKLYPELLDEEGFYSNIHYLATSVNNTTVQSSSLFVFSDYERQHVTLVGAGSFYKSEGNIILSHSHESGDSEITFQYILDGKTLCPGEEMMLDDIIILDGHDMNTLLQQWADLTAEKMSCRIPKTIPTGWNDWQYYRNTKTKQDIIDSAEVIADLHQLGYPLDYVQVDGGFCKYLSEWDTPKPGFGGSIDDISEYVSKMNLKFGLWLAPYIQNVETSVVKQHPEWLVRQKDSEEPLELPRSNVGTSVLIDYSIPEALEWLRQLTRMFIQKWNVKWIKLDGPNYNLYRMGRIKDTSITITEMLRRSFDVMRDEAGDDILLEGEGMMGLALGYVDLHRVQTDNHPDWYINKHTHRPYAPRVYGKELLMGFLHNRWWCNHRENVILRNFPSHRRYAEESGEAAKKAETIFPAQEQETQLAIAAMTSGGLLLTDPMKELKRLPDCMKRISKLLPVYANAAEPIDAFPDQRYCSLFKLPVNRDYDDYTLLLAVNWSDRIQDFSINLKDVIPDYTESDNYVAFSIFQELASDVTGSQIKLPGVTAHGCRLIALRKKQSHPHIVGTDIHLLAGAVELKNQTWDRNSSVLTIEINHFNQADCKLFFTAPASWKIQEVSGNMERVSSDDFIPEYPVIRYKGSNTSTTTTLEIKWTQS